MHKRTSNQDKHFHPADPGRGRPQQYERGPRANEVLYGNHQGWNNGQGMRPFDNNSRPDKRYGADYEYPNRESRFDGSEYGWRGDQAGRGGPEESYNGQSASEYQDEDSRFSSQNADGNGHAYNQFGNVRPGDRFDANTGAPRSQTGTFAGRGPKGYRRSDDRIKEEINERLTRHPEVDASGIDVEVRDGEVELTGTVELKHCKRMAEDIAEAVYGVNDVRNHIRVQRAGAEGLDAKTKTTPQPERNTAAKSNMGRA